MNTEINMLWYELARGITFNSIKLSLVFGIITVIGCFAYRFGREYDEEKYKQDVELISRDYDFDTIDEQHKHKHKYMVKANVSRDWQYIDVENYQDTEFVARESQANEETILDKIGRTLFESVSCGFIVFLFSLFIILLIIATTLVILDAVGGIGILKIMEEIQRIIKK